MTLQLLDVPVIDKRLSTGNFVAWCGENHLILNIKIKEMVLDFRNTRNKLYYCHHFRISGGGLQIPGSLPEFTWTKWAGNAALRLSSGGDRTDCTLGSLGTHRNWTNWFKKKAWLYAGACSGDPGAECTKNIAIVEVLKSRLHYPHMQRMLSQWEERSRGHRGRRRGEWARNERQWSRLRWRLTKKVK